jgi:hypothetical protein
VRGERLCVSVSEVLFATNAANRIISQTPEAGSRVEPGSVVHLVVDRDEGLPMPSRHVAKVPRLLGLSLPEAAGRLENVGISEWQALAIELPPSRAQTVGDAFVVTRQTRISYQQALQEYSSPFSPGASVRLALSPRKSLSCP